MRIKTLAVIRDLVATLAISTAALPALAEEAAPCGCSQPMTTGAALGSVTAASAGVLVSASNGLAAARVGSPLVLGSRVLVGPTGSAAISVGNGCQLDLPANSSAVVTADKGNLCVRTASAADRQSAFSSSASFGAPAGEVGAVATGGAPGVATGGLAGLGLTTTAVVGGIAVTAVVAGVVAVVVEDAKDDDKPVSSGR